MCGFQMLNWYVGPAGGDGLRTHLNNRPPGVRAGKREAEEAARVQPPHALNEVDTLNLNFVSSFCFGSSLPQKQLILTKGPAAPGHLYS